MLVSSEGHINIKESLVIILALLGLCLKSHLENACFPSIP